MNALNTKIALMRMGVKQSDIARALGVTGVAIHLVIHGHRTSKRISAYIENLLKNGKRQMRRAA